jgi:Putative translation initiation inhibitor, yjgF family
MEKKYHYFPWAVEAYKGSVASGIPEYAPVKIAHAVVTKGGKTLRMSGWPAIGKSGIVGVGDMAHQVTEALNHCLRTVEEVGGTWDNVIHLLIYFTDREKFWRYGLPARSAFLSKHSQSGDMPCITAVGVPALMHPDMLVEVEATAVF